MPLHNAVPLIFANRQRERRVWPKPDRFLETLDRLIELYTTTNKPDEVKKWRTERAKYPAELAPMPRSGVR